MSLDDNARSRSAPTDGRESGTTTVDVHAPVFVPSLTHRDIHTRPQHGCDRCPRVPCVCGWTVGLCPQAFEHRREYASSETTWRVSA
jgi:hypothetical protein